MDRRLDRLARSHGIEPAYISEQGERQVIGDAAKRALLGVLGVDPDEGEEGPFTEPDTQVRSRCFLPEGQNERTWGIACQLYALRSKRNLGMGDFEDLARLAEIAAEAGAAFVGVNPLHALFLAEPGRSSPYSPSSRRFLNPLYIAVDKLDRVEMTFEVDETAETDPEFLHLVDYGRVGAIKLQLLQAVFADQEETIAEEEAFRAFCEAGGEALYDFALFEALSADMVANGKPAGWHGWPEEYRDRNSEAVETFARENERAVRFYQWLQYAAEKQLGEAQRRAKAAGMRIGLYLDLAVGVAPDGADTWSDPALSVRAARVGSPPDLFNSEGQDWGLAPLSPQVLLDRGMKPLSDAFHALMKNAGAVRIDHAMGLARLWWIPEGETSAGGAYMRYPLGAMIDAVADASQDSRCLVIGEDLGTVPAGFRDAMSQAQILSYKVLYFERERDTAFLAPDAYPPLSLACVSTHDLPTLRGWWAGRDIALREETGRQNPEASERSRKDRERERHELVSALAEAEVLPERLKPAATGEAELPEDMADDVAAAVHRFAARTRSLLVVAQLDDMIGSTAQANLPGTVDEYPNWRIRCAVPLEELAADERFQTIARTMREERPETK